MFTEYALEILSVICIYLTVFPLGVDADIDVNYEKGDLDE